MRHKEFRDYWIRDKVCRELEREYGLAMDNGRAQTAPERQPLGEKAALLEAHTGQQSFEGYAPRRSAPPFCTHWRQWPHGRKPMKLLHPPWPGNQAARKRPCHQGSPQSANHKGQRPGQKPVAEKAGSPAAHSSHRKGWSIFRNNPVIGLNHSTVLRNGSKLCRIPARDCGAQNTPGTDQATGRRRPCRHPGRVGRQAPGIRRMGIDKRNRRRLIQVARKHEAEALATARSSFHKQRETVRQDVPFTSWNGFLQHKADQGNEVALAVLRSRTNTVEVKHGACAVPEKDWSQHGRDLFTDRNAVRAAQAAAERTPCWSQRRSPAKANPGFFPYCAWSSWPKRDTITRKREKPGKPLRQSPAFGMLLTARAR